MSAHITPLTSYLPPELILAEPGFPSPAEAYLNTLSFRAATQATALADLTSIFSNGKLNDPFKFAWQNLSYEQTSILPAYMIHIGYAKSSVNKHLSPFGVFWKKPIAWDCTAITTVTIVPLLSVPCATKRFPAAERSKKANLTRLSKPASPIPVTLTWPSATQPSLPRSMPLPCAVRR